MTIQSHYLKIYWNFLKTWLRHLYGDVKVRKLNEYDQEYDRSNITIYFAEGNHGDSMLFDGIDGELAHSCSLSNTKSPFRGHIHFDDSENWHMGKQKLSLCLKFLFKKN